MVCTSIRSAHCLSITVHIIHTISNAIKLSNSFWIVETAVGLVLSRHCHGTNKGVWETQRWPLKAKWPVLYSARQLQTFAARWLQTRHSSWSIHDVYLVVDCVESGHIFHRNGPIWPICRGSWDLSADELHHLAAKLLIPAWLWGGQGGYGKHRSVGSEMM